MKKLSIHSVMLLLLVGFSLNTISCKKEDKKTGSNGTVGFKLDGVQKTYKIAYGQHIDVGIDSWVVVASETGDTTANSIYLSVGNDGTISADLPYSEDNAIITIKCKTAGSELLQNNYNNCVAYFSELGPDRMTGSFSGTIKDGSGTAKSVTEGTFDVPVQ